MAIEKRDKKKVVGAGCVVYIDSNSPGSFKEDFVYKVSGVDESRYRDPYFTIEVELDSKESKSNGHTSEYFRITTQAEVYSIINQPYHINQVEILLGVNIKDRGEVLIAAAKLRGFVEGARIIGLDSPAANQYIINTRNERSNYDYYESADDLYVSCVGGNRPIYRQGKWSEIVEKAPKKEMAMINGKKIQSPGVWAIAKSGLNSNLMELPDKWWEKVEVGDILRCVGDDYIFGKTGTGWGKDLEFKVLNITDDRNSTNQMIFFGGYKGRGVYSDYVEPVKCKNISSDVEFRDWSRYLKKVTSKVYGISVEMLGNKEVQEILPIKIRKKKKRIKVEVLNDSKIKE